MQGVFIVNIRLYARGRRGLVGELLTVNAVPEPAGILSLQQAARRLHAKMSQQGIYSIKYGWRSNGVAPDQSKLRLSAKAQLACQAIEFTRTSRWGKLAGEKATTQIAFGNLPGLV